MSKPVYEIPVTGDEIGQPVGFPPPARDARPRNIATAPPPSGHAPTYPTEPAAPFTSPPPTIAPEGGWPPAAPVAAPALALAPTSAPTASAPPTLPPTPGLTMPPEPVAPVFTAPMPDGAWAGAPVLAPSNIANFPPPAAPGAMGAPSSVLAPEQFAPSAAPNAAADLPFAPPSAENLNYAEQMFAMDGVSSTLATADPDLIAALSEVLFLNASDLHIAVNTPPMFRVDGGLAPRSITTPWGRDKVTSALRSILTEAQEERFDEELELDIAYTISANARFRVNMYQQRGAIGAAFRLIPTEIKSLVELGVPDTVAQFCGSNSSTPKTRY